MLIALLQHSLSIHEFIVLKMHVIFEKLWNFISNPKCIWVVIAHWFSNNTVELGKRLTIFTHNSRSRILKFWRFQPSAYGLAFFCKNIRFLARNRAYCRRQTKLLVGLGYVLLISIANSRPFGLCSETLPGRLRNMEENWWQYFCPPSHGGSWARQSVVTFGLLQFAENTTLPLRISRDFRKSIWNIEQIQNAVGSKLRDSSMIHPSIIGTCDKGARLTSVFFGLQRKTHIHLNIT